MGETTTRLRAMTPPSSIGVNSSGLSESTSILKNTARSLSPLKAASQSYFSLLSRTRFLRSPRCACICLGVLGEHVPLCSSHTRVLAQSVPHTTVANSRRDGWRLEMKHSYVQYLA